LSGELNPKMIDQGSEILTTIM